MTDSQRWYVYEKRTADPKIRRWAVGDLDDIIKERLFSKSLIVFGPYKFGKGAAYRAALHLTRAQSWRGQIRLERVIPVHPRHKKRLAWLMGCLKERIKSSDFYDAYIPRIEVSRDRGDLNLFGSEPPYIYWAGIAYHEKQGINELRTQALINYLAAAWDGITYANRAEREEEEARQC